jgi:peptidoglycan/xylan/chitin deacetylase (PgdA/CDA1 family)
MALQGTIVKQDALSAGSELPGRMRPKEVLFRIAKRVGAFALVRDSEWRRQRLLILCYHGVSLHDEHEWNGDLYITPALLRDRLQLLRDRGYSILPLDDACRLLREGRLPPRSVSVTFDDATVDFERMALPILREFDAPTTLYLTSFYTDLRVPVFDTVLSYVLWKGRASGADVAALCDSATPLPIATQGERDRAHTALRRHAAQQSLDALAKDALVARVAAHVGVSYGDVLSSEILQLMTPDSVAALPHDLVDVQMHTHRHRAPCERLLFRRELTDNAGRIREMRGPRSPLTHFCYPNGEYRGDLLPWLREFGVEFATTCLPGIASPGDEPLLLPRFVDSCRQSPTAFEAWASGFAALLPQRRQYRIDANLLRVSASV